ncbi:hypothetical protein [Guptibacillus sedimenti]|uniref:hypothetical protein n=1 Tax=Guptibacillus sedimenti TaxID=3025680 RepID=UPI00235FCC75|nr:hypothetical protein [Pseudalkalibacillus sedimenti]
MGVAEAITQSFSDTYEDEGVAYVAGNVSTAFIPYVGMAGKSASLAKVAGKIPNAKPSKVAGSSKVDVAAIVKKHKAFEGIKRGMGEFVQDVKGGMQVAGNPNRVAVGANGVAGNAVGKVGDVAESGVASVSRSGGSNRAVDDSIVRIKTEVERVDGGKGIKGTDEINRGFNEPKVAEQIIEERTKGMDLWPHPTQQKQLSALKMKELKVKIENRTITKIDISNICGIKSFRNIELWALTISGIKNVKE